MSLSDDRIITLLNSSFVPVFTSNEDYRDAGPAPADERALLERIRQEGLRKGLSVGTVHAFVLTSGGEVIDSLHTVDAAKPDVLLSMLTRAAQRLDVKAGSRVAPLTAPPAPATGGGLVLRLTARYLEKRDGKLLPVQNAGGNWSALPGEDLVTVTRDQVRELIRDGKSSVWNQILTHFYPPTENNDCSKNVLLDVRRETTIDDSDAVVRRYRVTGDLKMKHWFYHKPDDWVVSATFAGYFDVDTRAAQIRRFRMVTETAIYTDGRTQRLPFGVAVREADR